MSEDRSDNRAQAETSAPKSEVGGDLLDIIIPDVGPHRFWRRQGEEIGGLVFSVQAGEFNYCEPRASGLPMTAYSAVELAMFVRGGGWLKPRDLVGLTPGFDELFEGDDVAGYVPLERAKALRDALHRWAAAGARIEVSRG